MPVLLWFALVFLLAAGLLIAAVHGAWWIVAVFAALLALVLAAMGWAVWAAWLSTREGG
jgi:hypothetical protein